MERSNEEGVGSYEVPWAAVGMTLSSSHPGSQGQTQPGMKSQLVSVASSDLCEVSRVASRVRSRQGLTPGKQPFSSQHHTQAPSSEDPWQTTQRVLREMYGGWALDRCALAGPAEDS